MPESAAQMPESRFVIVREDLQVAPVVLITDGLKIGRLLTCELVLNHPTVSRLHAGITEAHGRFYFYNFSISSGTTLNNRVVPTKTAEVLADGDVLQIGPFFIQVSRAADALTLHVTLNFAVAVGDPLRRAQKGMQYAPPAPEPSHRPPETTDALGIFWESRQREEGKMRGRSLLHPQRPSPVLGRTQFNWMPTRDLMRPWPFSGFPVRITIALLTVFLAAGWLYVGAPWWGWIGAAVLFAAAGVLLVLRDSRRERHLLEEPPPKTLLEDDGNILSKDLLERYDPDGPPYPHPVVITERCIGCNACMDACPHDVLAVINGLAVPVARDQCMDDTSCQIECPVNPKAIIVVNTLRKIKPRTAPLRDASFMTNVPGCYIIGDASHTPLIKNAINEGADVIDHIVEEIKQPLPPEPRAEFDVAIIGVGPAGLSAAILAARHNLKYVGIEQDRVLATVEDYPKNKYLFFKPETMEVRGPIPVEGAGAMREEVLETWHRAMVESGVRINEGECCKLVKRAEDGDYFVIITESGFNRMPATYNARRVVLALGNRGTPMRLNIPGEEMKITRNGRSEDKVMYKLTNPEEYKRSHIIVVGGGNSAVEAAIDLVARRDGDRIQFRPEEEINDVTLVVRSDFKNDLKFRNKMQLYDCIDAGKIEAFFETSIKEIRDDEVVLQNARTKEVKVTVANDFIFALIGGDRPTKFLESIGIKIG